MCGSTRRNCIWLSYVILTYLSRMLGGLLNFSRYPPLHGSVMNGVKLQYYMLYVGYPRDGIDKVKLKSCILYDGHYADAMSGIYLQYCLLYIGYYTDAINRGLTSSVSYCVLDIMMRP